MEKEYIVECKTKEQTNIVFAKLYPGLDARLAYYKYVKSNEDHPPRKIDNDLSYWEESYPVYTFEEWKRMIDVKLVTDLKKGEAIICQNLEEAKAIRQLMHDAVLKSACLNDWVDSKYNTVLCFFPATGQLERNTSEQAIIDCAENNYKLFPASDFLQNTEQLSIIDVKVDTAIQCTTQEEANRISALLNEQGYRWQTGDSLLTLCYWDNDEYCLCISNGKRISKGHAERYEKEKIPIIKATQFINLTTKTMKSVTQEQLKEIHKIACESWKPRIEEYAKRNVFNDVNLTDKEVQEMFEAATSAQKPVLEKIFGKKENLLHDMPDREFAQSQYTKAYFYREDDVLFGFSIDNGCLTTISSNAIDKVGNWTNVPATYLGKSIQL